MELVGLFLWITYIALQHLWYFHVMIYLKYLETPRDADLALISTCLTRIVNQPTAISETVTSSSPGSSFSPHAQR